MSSVRSLTGRCIFTSSAFPSLSNDSFTRVLPPTSHNNPQPSTVSLFIVWLLDEHLAKTFYGPCVQFSVVILPAPSRTTLSTLDDYQSSRALAESQVKCAFNLSLVFFLIFLLPELLTLYSRLTQRDFRFYLSVWNIIY